MRCNIRIVLVQTSCSANIGAVARAMQTMGLKKLVLVDPQCEPQSLDAMAMAAGAQAVLLGAQVVATLGEALKDCHFVAGTSARNRELPWAMLAPKQLADQVAALPKTREVAIVFGREKNGLTNDELAQCQVHIQIPTAGNYTSLNLAQAVQIISYELCQALLATELELDVDVNIGIIPNQAEIHSFFERLEQLLVDLQLLNREKPKKLMPRLKRFLYRANPDKEELDILQGIVTAIKKIRESNFKSD